MIIELTIDKNEENTSWILDTQREEEVESELDRDLS